ncbi:stalk domain-containing protein [Brevibacillus sp. NRS-1366]|uniref:stalk domain-containing protein n=1 Tax=Brevibacillus sp. NRS-1366 TaxID=3233899 RepID=UPI003D234C59
MKGKSVLAVVLGVQLLTAHPVAAAPASSVASAIVVNGEEAALQKTPLLIQQRTYIYAQDASKILQAAWSQEGNTGRLKLGEASIQFQLDTGKVAVNGNWKQDGQRAIVRDGNVYLPLRWLSEQAGYQIKWNAEKKAVEIIAAQHEEQFALVDAEKLTKEERAFIESVKSKKGVYNKGELYVIARGPSPNPGYGLQVVKVQQSWEQLFVYVKQTSPDPDKMYPQVITYPYLVGKAKLAPYTTLVVIDVDTNKPFLTQENVSH